MDQGQRQDQQQDQWQDQWLRRAHQNSGWLVVFGVVEMVCGGIIVSSPLAGGLAVSVVFGIFMILGGLTRVIASLAADSFGAGAFALLWGIILAATGFYVALNPEIGLAALTMWLSVMFFATGMLQTLVALRMRPARGWGWMLAGGTITFVLAILVTWEFPISATWLVGTLVGINFIFNGLTTVEVGLVARKVTAPA